MKYLSNFISFISREKKIQKVKKDLLKIFNILHRHFEFGPRGGGRTQPSTVVTAFTHVMFFHVYRKINSTC